MADKISPKIVRELLSKPRWSALARLEEPLISITSWDASLMRKPRVLVPVNVQALYVPEDGDEAFVQLPFALTTVDGAGPADMPDPFDPGSKRPKGVHLHWAMPDSLLSGTLTEQDPASANRLALPLLPDRWVVLRLLVPRGAQRAAVTGWVIEADSTKVTALKDWPNASAALAATGKTVDKASLTGTIGGTLNWSGCYDAVANRFAFHDALSDLPAEGVLGDFATYLVCGWWSDPRLDPLDAAATNADLRKRLNHLKWRLFDDLKFMKGSVLRETTKLAKQAALNLPSQPRHQNFVFGGKQSAAQLKEIVTVTAGGRFTETAGQFAPAVVREPHASLLHGVIHGVPVAGGVIADQRPKPDEISLAFGQHSDDVAAVFAASGLGLAQTDERRDVERLLSGFTNGILSGLATSNGLLAIEEAEHVAGFSSRPGEPGPTERVIESASAEGLPGTRAARTAIAGKRSVKEESTLATELFWSPNRKGKVANRPTEKMRLAREISDNVRNIKTPPASRLVTRPTPRYFEPMEPMLAMRGAKRNLRQSFDKYRSPDGRLQCRWPAQVADALEGIIKGSELVSAFPSGGLPPEVLRLVHNAICTDPYLAPWRTDVVSKAKGFDRGALENRMFAETALRFKPDGSYSTSGWAEAGAVKASPYREAVAAQSLNRFSLVAGVDADPVCVTAWSQPWVPMWLEWEVALKASDRLEGWSLGPIDLQTEDNGAPPTTSDHKIAGRSPLHTGVAATLSNAITAWLKAEQERDNANQGEVDEDAEKLLSEIAHAVTSIDILSANFDSLHDALLGLPVGPYGVLQPRQGAAIGKPSPVALPQLLLSGVLQITRARLIDAFGRTLDLPTEKIVHPARDAIGDRHSVVRPRLLRPARWLFRLVDPGDLASTAREATIDQLEPALMVNPVAGFLLPDHIDEALEFFDAAGTPLGQLFHEPVSGGVTWEIAPGREGPPDAGPHHGLQQNQQVLGLMAASVVATDASLRGGAAAQEAEESTLSALLRAIDTTLWTVDTFAVLGGTHVAGLVGRPIAVVRATLRLDIKSDVDELSFASPQLQAEREAAFSNLADRAFPVRLGEITRDDDGLLGFFIDDDYAHFHIIDKVVRDQAPDSGRGRGHLGILGSAPASLPVKPITHPYTVAEDEILVRPGQTVRLTLLMHPGGKCHLTSGMLPRKSLQLSRDWVHDGLAALAPSARVGPVLIDTDKVRLPLIASFGAEQLWTRRDSASTWKDDPILAATQTALLPEDPAMIEEGYIRIAPVKGGTGEGA